jgi:hypothetical protein
MGAPDRGEILDLGARGLSGAVKGAGGSWAGLTRLVSPICGLEIKGWSIEQ